MEELINYTNGEDPPPRGSELPSEETPEVIDRGPAHSKGALDQTLRSMIILGVPKEDAISKIAADNGLGTLDADGARINWTLKQVQGLLFLRTLVASGKVTDANG